MSETISPIPADPAPIAAGVPLTLVAVPPATVERGPPGLTLAADGGTEPELRVTCEVAWDPADWLVFDVLYEGPRCGILRLHFDAGLPDGRQGLAGFTVLPGVPARVAFPLRYLDAQQLKLERRPGSLRCGYNGPPLPPSALREVRLSLKAAQAPHRLHLRRAWLARSEPHYPVAPVVLVDALGQWTQREWPGKTPDVATLRRCLREEHEHTRIAPAQWPSGWSRHGGSTDLRFTPTGWFRTERTTDRWWLVDPEGHAFYSIGMNGIVPGVAGPLVKGEEGYYAEPPVAGEGTPPIFAARNLEKAFGRDAPERWLELTHDRLVRWGFNTIGNWSDAAMRAAGRLPYVLQWPRYPGTALRLFRDFPDVFDPAFERDATHCAQALAATREDPRLIGYFMMNEPKWGFGEFNLAALMLEGSTGSFSRRALAAWVAERFEGDDARWAAAWNLPPASSFTRLTDEAWRAEELAAPRAQTDLWAFSRLLVRRFVEIPVRAARAVDPHHLNLGLRYAYLASDLLLEGGECFDVFSINAYGFDPPLRVVETIESATGRPVMIGEFHFGAPDRGLPSTGLRGVPTQTDRGLAYQRFVEQAAAHRAVVGTHWFYLNDQPLLGRGDGENYQIGFVDVCHRPYDALVERARVTHQQLYDVARGLRSPATPCVQEIPNHLYPSTQPEAWRAPQ